MAAKGDEELLRRFGSQMLGSYESGMAKLTKDEQMAIGFIAAQGAIDAMRPEIERLRRENAELRAGKGKGS